MSNKSLLLLRIIVPIYMRSAIMSIKTKVQYLMPHPVPVLPVT